jgi:dTDP-4-dehydrorhamnose 3,5-epimerase/CDP-3, 6-dideoxy-D-glycero-D-glycero-4-hexulose-5-epimerase
MTREEFIIDRFISEDVRGSFDKPFSKNNKLLADFNLHEAFVSTSFPGVLRGLHYQRPPHQHKKVISVLAGKVLDCVVCVDHANPEFGNTYSFVLKGQDTSSILVPEGFAHGFLSIGEEPAKVLYLTSSNHNTNADTGVLWNSIGFNWGIEKPIISDRDAQLPKFGEHEW